MIARGVFASGPDLKRKFMRYIQHYNTQPKPVKWTYFDASRRIVPESILPVHYFLTAVVLWGDVRAFYGMSILASFEYPLSLPAVL